MKKNFFLFKSRILSGWNNDQDGVFRASLSNNGKKGNEHSLVETWRILCLIQFVQLRLRGHYVAFGQFQVDNETLNLFDSYGREFTSTVIQVRGTENTVDFSECNVYQSALNACEILIIDIVKRRKSKLCTQLGRFIYFLSDIPAIHFLICSLSILLHFATISLSFI